MAPDLHQRTHARSLLSLGTCALLVVAGLTVGARAQITEDVGLEPPRGPTPCAIDGRAAISSLEVTRRSRHGHHVVSRVDVPVREVRVQVLSPTRFHVATRVGDPVFEGHTETRPPLSLRRDVLLGGVRVRRGAPILRTTPREQSLDVDIDLGASAVLRRYVIGCDVLRVREPEGMTETRLPSPHHPHWIARGREIAMRERGEEGLEVARVALPPAVVLEELGRSDAYVHVRAQLPYATLDGWVRDSTLTPAPRARR